MVTLPKRRQTDYNPNALLDALLIIMQLKNDAALARKLRLQPDVIGRLRNALLPMEPAILLRMHEVIGISIPHLRYLLRDRRSVVRSSTWQD